MSSQEEHRRKFPEKFETQLHISEDRDGDLNLDAFEITGKLDARLRMKEWYIGLAQFGSRTRGHPEKNSDFDVVVFGDAGLLGFDMQVPRAAFEESVKQEAKRIAPGRDCHIAFEYLKPEDIGALYRDFGPYLLGQTVMGPRIEEFREKYAEEIRQMEKEEQERFLEKVASSMIAMERYSFRAEHPDRIGPGAIQAGAFEARHALWKEQFRQALRL